MRLLIILGTLGVLLAACGGSDGEERGDNGANGSAPQENTSRGGALTDPCTLVTKPEAEALLGVPVDAPQKQPVGPFQTCGYYAMTAILDFVQVQVCACLPGNQFDTAMRGAAMGSGVEPKAVSGIGDKAFWLNGILWVQRGQYALNLWVASRDFRTAGGQALDAATLEQRALPVHVELARKVLSRLP
jgi:hypothetical protein